MGKKVRCMMDILKDGSISGNVRIKSANSLDLNYIRKVEQVL
jgi:hypothetical protein